MQLLGSFIKVNLLPSFSVRMMSNASAYSYETLQITSPSENVLHVELNRPDKRIAMNRQFFV